jgi:hypothetical protein
MFFLFYFHIQSFPEFCSLSFSEEKRPLGRPRHRWVDNIQIKLTKMRWGGYGLD